MPQSPLRLIKHYAEYLPADRINEIPYGVRGIYVLYRHRLRSKAYDVVYVGLAGVGKRSGMRGRLLKHRRTKRGLWSHFSAFVVWDNVSAAEVRELEGLFRHIYRHDTTANALNRQKSFKLMRQVFSDDPRSWRPSAQAT